VAGHEARTDAAEGISGGAPVIRWSILRQITIGDQALLCLASQIDDLFQRLE
jgi:hypothetical protein